MIHPKFDLINFIVFHRKTESLLVFNWETENLQLKSNIWKTTIEYSLNIQMEYTILHKSSHENANNCCQRPTIFTETYGFSESISDSRLGLLLVAGGLIEKYKNFSFFSSHWWENQWLMWWVGDCSLIAKNNII